MKNSRKHQGRHFIVIGIALAVLYWIIDAAIMVFKFHEGSFAQQLLAPESSELWMRSWVAVVILLFGLYAKVNANRRAHAEEALEQAAQQWQRTFDALDDMVAIIDSDFRIVRANQATLEAFPGTDVVGAHCYEVFHGTEAPIANCPAWQAFQTHESARTEICEAHLGGCWLDVYSAPIMSTAGTISQVVHVVHDITERKQAEDALKHFKSTVESSSDAVGMSTPGGHHWYQNKAYDELFGDIGTDAPASVFANEEIGREVFATIMAGDEWTGEIEMRGKDGEILDILLRAYAIKDEDGKVSGLVGLHTDITERKQAEEALQAAHQRNETILATSMDGVMTIRPDGSIVECNEAFCEIAGYSRDELLDMKIGDLFAHLTAEEVGEVMQQVMQVGPHRFETAIRHKDGTLVDLEISATFVELPENSFFVSFARDISETKKLWDELNHQLVRDGLTGVYNRRYFNETIIQEISRADRYGHQVSFIMGDIDGLKAVNDNCGHLVGDQILQGVAHSLEQASRAADIVIRYGGDEFLVVMPETGPDQARNARNRFEQAFSEWLARRARDGTLPSDLPADLGFSMGMACYEPGSDVAVEEVLSQADVAMYRAKQAKRAQHATV